MIIRIQADFNSMTEDGKCWALYYQDIERFKDRLTPGLSVVLYMPDTDENDKEIDIEVDAILEFEKGWVAKLEESTYRYIPRE